MPRGKGKGGAREGAPGKNYANRGDLRDRLPVQTAPGQGYGESALQAAAQRAVPMGPQQIAASPAGPAGAPMGGAPGGMTPPALPSGPGPGELLFTHPTERPEEPITAGVDGGPGPGPEALQRQPVTAVSPLQEIISHIADQPFASSKIKDLLNQLRMN